MVYEVIPVGWSRSKHKETQVFQSCDTNRRQNPIIKVANKSFENWAKFKYLGIMATNQNCTHAEITSRLKWGSVFYYSALQKPICLWSCRLAKGVSRQTLLNAVDIDQNVKCFIKFQFSMFHWTFAVAYSTAKLKIRDNNGSPYFTPFIYFTIETLK